jgi:DNA polymerase III sliding clamp (beta) subunit (PCNA family)
MITLPTLTARAIDAIAARVLAGAPPHANAIAIAWQAGFAAATAIGSDAEARMEFAGIGLGVGVVTLAGGALGKVAAVVDDAELTVADAPAALPPAVVITSGRDAWKILPGPPAEDLSPWREPEGHAITIDGATLARCVAIAASAAARKDHRRQLMGVHVAMEAGRVSVIGTDGRRLERLRIPAEPHEARRATATRAWCDALAALKPSGPVELRIDAAGDLSVAVAMPWGRVVLRTRGEPGKYPDVDQVLPRNPPLSFVADVSALAAAIRRAAIAEPDAGGVLLVIGEDRSATVSAASSDVGEASDAFALASFSVHAGAPPPPWSAKFNSQYLSETLATYAGQVRFRGAGGRAPWLVESMAPEAGLDRLSLVMPIVEKGGAQ